MSITLETYPITIRKGGKFYQEFQLLDDDSQPLSFSGMTLKGRIVESKNSSVVLADLTEVGGGVVQVDTANGIFGILLTSAETALLTASYGFYDILQIDDAYPTIESDYIVEGPVTFEKGVTEQ